MLFFTNDGFLGLIFSRVNAQPIRSILVGTATANAAKMAITPYRVK
jgi:hypothetical protein